MAKGLFTQGVCLLTDGRTTIQHVKHALEQGGFEVVKEAAATSDNVWMGSDTLIVPYRPEVNGLFAVDLVPHPWPDDMGDPKINVDLFGAWAMGHMCPMTFPGNLERAAQHSWCWEPGNQIATGHQGFIRIRLSYGFGANEDAKCFPADYDSTAEMMFISRMVSTLFETTGVVCYFNPGGEVLRDQGSFTEMLDACNEADKLPLSLWMNVRFFNLGDDLGFMDTVGNGQLDVPDVEAAFSFTKYEPGDIDYYLRNVTHYLINSGKELQAGEPIDGPGESNLSWIIERPSDSVVAPPRNVVRLYSRADGETIKKVLANVG